MNTPHLWTLIEARTALEQRACSAEELTRHMLTRIAQYNGTLHAFVQVSEQALDTARRLDERRAHGERLGPLAGIPIAVKDLIDTANLATSYGGRHFRGHIPKVSAEVVRRLEEADAIVIGKTNLHEYAFGTTTENPHYGNTTNPWNRFKISGGSSGGSSAAIVAGLAFAALGTDTGGSIRIPAALTGHVGFKPSFGLVSKRGVFALAPTLDHVGPMTKTVADAALMLSVIAGFDALDPSSVRIPARDYHVRVPDRPIRIGIPKTYFYERCHPTVLQVVHQALSNLQSEGIILEEVDLEDIQEVPEAQGAIIASEALSIHESMLSTQPALYGDDVRRRLESATEVSGSAYIRARAFRDRFIHNLRQVFAHVDVIVTPATPLPATDIGQLKAHIRTQEVPVRGHLTRYTNPWNLSGLPAISLPCGFTPDGLPVGIQCVGWRFSEPKLLMVAQEVERLMPGYAVAPDYR